jgi:hypothetical protein
LDQNSRELVVEDIDAKHAAIHLVKGHVAWTDHPPWPVFLRVGKSCDEILKKEVVADLQLASIGAQNVHVGGGILPTTAHLVNIGLPNRVMFAMLRVAQVALHGGIDVLIGMDILGAGDFTVTHHNGNTTFSFCCHPEERLTLWPRSQRVARLPRFTLIRLEETAHVRAVAGRNTKSAADLTFKRLRLSKIWSKLVEVRWTGFEAARG